MKQFNGNIEEELDKEFRLLVGKLKGVRKGAISEALSEALELWMDEKKQENKKNG